MELIEVRSISTHHLWAVKISNKLINIKPLKVDMVIKNKKQMLKSKSKIKNYI